MSKASIPVDLFNPGQVFACLGFVELAEALVGPTRAGFDWSEPAEARFVISVEGDVDPIARGLGFLAEAEVRSLVPAGSDLSTEKWKVPSCRSAPESAFPIPLPSTPASLPAVLVANDRTVVLSSWGEVRTREVLASQRDNVKFWAGSGGYPGVGLLRDALEAVRPHLTGAGPDPFAVSVPQSSSFRFDWRRDYIPIDIGFSLNEHSAMQPRGYPVVEVLAAIGLSHARPLRRRKLEYRYTVAGRSDVRQDEDRALLPALLLRASLGTSELPFPTRTFTMHLDWPGQENQARCITTVQEETSR